MQVVRLVDYFETRMNENVWDSVGVYLADGIGIAIVRFKKTKNRLLYLETRMNENENVCSCYMHSSF